MQPVPPTNYEINCVSRYTPSSAGKWSWTLHCCRMWKVTGCLKVMKCSVATL